MVVVIKRFELGAQFQELFETGESKSFQGLDLNVELLKVIKIWSPSEIPKLLKDLNVKLPTIGIDGILSNFDGFMSVLLNWKKIAIELRWDAHKLLLSISKCFLAQLQNSNGGLNDDNRQTFCTIIKVIVYLLSKYYENFLPEIIINKKDSKIAQNDLNLVLSILEEMFRCNLSKLWESGIVEEELVVFLFDFILYCIEKNAITRDESTQTSIKFLIGSCLNLSSNPLSLSTKIYANMTHIEQVNAYFSKYFSSSCSNDKVYLILKHIFREIAFNIDKDLSEQAETGGSVSTNHPIKNTAEFLNFLCESSPLNAYEGMTKLFFRLQSTDSYMLRVAILLGMSKCIVSSPQLNNAKTIFLTSQLIDALEMHLFDISTQVRAKSIQSLEILIRRRLIKNHRILRTISLVLDCYTDEGVYVRKAVLDCVKAFIETYEISFEKHISVLKGERDVLLTTIHNFGQEVVNSQPKESWTTLINKLSENIDQNECMQKFSSQNDAFDIILNLLESGSFFDCLKVFTKMIKAYPNKFKISSLNNNNKQEVQNGKISGDMQAILHTFKDLYFVFYLPKTSIGEQSSSYIFLVEVYNLQIEFTNMISEMLDLVLKTLNSDSVTDVSEAINFFTFLAVRKMSKAKKYFSQSLPLYSSMDTKLVKDSIINNFEQIFICRKDLNDNDQPNSVVRALLGLYNNMNKCEIANIQDIINKYVNNGKISDQVIKNMILAATSNNFNHDKKVNCLHLLNIIASSESSVIKSQFQRILDYSYEYQNIEYFDYALKLILNLFSLKDNFIQTKYFSHDSQLQEHIMKSITDNMFLGENMYESFLCSSTHAFFVVFDEPIIVVNKALKLIIGKYLEKKVDKDSNENYSIELDNGTVNLVFFSGLLAHKEKSNLNKLQSMAQRSKKLKSYNESMVDTSDIAENLNDTSVAAEKVKESIHSLTNSKILTSDSSLGRLLLILKELSINTCKDQKVNKVSSASILALSKFCLINEQVCKSLLPTIFEVMTKTTDETLRSSLPICLADVCLRFPVIFESWKDMFCIGLSDKLSKVRYTTLYCLTWLISKDLFKIKGNAPLIAKCLMDNEEHVVKMAENFFKELSLKNNQLYNVMSDIIGYFAEKEMEIDIEKYSRMVNYLINLISNSVQITNLVEIICLRMDPDK
ncbi:MAG: Ncapd2p [Paramarteilia canceri]